MSTEVELVADLRAMLTDEDGTRNILNKKRQVYTDAQLLFFLKRAVKDLNSGIPTTDYSIEAFPDDELIITGAIIQSMIAEGILQLRNHLDYSDAGLTVSMFNKTSGYQSWAGFLMQTYEQDKLDFKRGVIASSPSAGFLGIRSQCSVDWGRY